MSRLNLNEINFEEADFVVGFKKEKKEETSKADDFDEKKEEVNEAQQKLQKELEEKINEAQLIINRARDEAQQIVDEAKLEAQTLKETTQKELQEEKEKIITEATARADEIVENAKIATQKENENLINNSKEEIEKERIEITKKGYEDGHKDGLEHIQEELEEKIKDFDTFIALKYEMRDKILKSTNKDILDLIINISKKILLKEIDANTLDKIIKSAISLLEKKENINIILSEKYARLLYEVQKQALDDEREFKFEDFKQYENFEIIYNKEFDDDTIIVENLKERFDASIGLQLDVIIRNIYDNSQNGKLDLEEYLENEAEWFK